MTRIDFRSAPLSPDLSPKILRLGDAQGYLIAPARNAGDLLLFNQQGEFVRTIGRTGAGPEEHADITALMQDQRDSIWVFDEGNQKVDIYSSDLTFTRSMRISGSVSRAVALPSGSVVLQGSPVHPELAGYHTWILDRSGRVQPLAARLGDENEASLQSLALEGSDAAWVVEGHRYAAALISATGDTIRVIGSPPEWFKPSPRADQFADLMDLRPAVLDLMQSDDHVLWMLVGVPEQELPDPATLGGLSPSRILDLFIDHVIVAIDSRNGAHLAEAHFDYLPGGFIGDGMFAAIEDDEVGERWVQIYRLDVVGLN